MASAFLASLRQLGLTFNRRYEQGLFLIVPGSLILGFLFSDSFIHGVPLIPYLFAYVTLYMGLGCGFREIRDVFRKPSLMIYTFAIAHVVSPLLAYALGVVVLGPDSPYLIGLVLFTIIPLGVSSVLWVGMSGGNVPLILAMVVIDSALSPFVVPTGIHLLFNASVEIDTMKMMFDLMTIIVLPTFVGVLLNQATRGQIRKTIEPLAAPLSKFAFTAVVLLNAAAIAPQAHKIGDDLLKLVVMALITVAICYALGFFGSMLPWLRWRSAEATISISFAAGMRNISLGIVIALAYFSEQTAIPVVLAILIQQPVATLHQLILRKFYNRPANK